MRVFYASKALTTPNYKSTGLSPRFWYCWGCDTERHVPLLFVYTIHVGTTADMRRFMSLVVVRRVPPPRPRQRYLSSSSAFGATDQHPPRRGATAQGAEEGTVTTEDDENESPPLTPEEQRKQNLQRIWGDYVEYMSEQRDKGWKT